MTKRGLIGIITALFLVLGLATAFAAPFEGQFGQIDGLRSNNGVTLPTNVTNSGSAAAIGLNFDNGAAISPELDNFVNPGGIGDVLTYNYYNAREGFITWFTVVNTSSVGVRARVRVKEAENIAKAQCGQGSNDILDFDICLSEYDMWSGWIQGGEKAGEPAMLCSFDNDTLIWPWNAEGEAADLVSRRISWVEQNKDAGATVYCQPFKYGSSNLDITADQTHEGYVEIFGLNTLLANGSTRTQHETCVPIYDRVTGDTPGTNPGELTNAAEIDAPNVLIGNAFIADATAPQTTIFAYNATAIADFTDLGIFAGIATDRPDFRDGQDRITGVNYILTKKTLYANYLINNPWETEYVITLPTKRITEIVYSCGTTIFDNTVVGVTVFDDAENSEHIDCVYSPCESGSEQNLPYEVNVVKLGQKSGTYRSDIIPAAENKTGTRVNMESPYNFGWLQIDLDSDSVGDSVGHFTFATDGDTIWGTFGWPALALQLNQWKGFTYATPMQYNTEIVAIPYPEVGK